MNAYRFIFIAAIASLLPACSILDTRGEPSTVYSPALHTALPATAGADIDTVPWQLVVQTPQASAALETRRIVVVPQPGVIEVYKGARWRDTAPAMVRDMLVGAFDDSGRITGVAAVGTGLSADYTLSLRLRDFQIEFIDAQPYAVINIYAKLISYATSRAVGAHRVHAAVPARSADSDAVAEAMEEALNQVLPQLAAWSLQQGTIHHAGLPSGKPGMTPGD